MIGDEEETPLYRLALWAHVLVKPDGKGLLGRPYDDRAKEEFKARLKYAIFKAVPKARYPFEGCWMCVRIRHEDILEWTLEDDLRKVRELEDYGWEAEFVELNDRNVYE